MTRGELRKETADGVIEATVGPDGWESPDPEWGRQLERSYPTGGEVIGVAWVRAFWLAVEDLNAEVVAEPKADPGPPGVVY